MNITITIKDDCIIVRKGFKKVVYSGSWLTDYSIEDIIKDFARHR